MKEFIKQTYVAAFRLPLIFLTPSGRLIVDAITRPTPKDMLAHPWIVTTMKQEVNMGRWIREVWDWPKPVKKVKDA